jgi:hypothetical protein
MPLQTFAMILNQSGHNLSVHIGLKFEYTVYKKLEYKNIRNNLNLNL